MNGSQSRPEAGAGVSPASQTTELQVNSLNALVSCAVVWLVRGPVTDRLIRLAVDGLTLTVDPDRGSRCAHADGGQTSGHGHGLSVTWHDLVRRALGDLGSRSRPGDPLADEALDSWRAEVPVMLLEGYFTEDNAGAIS